MQSGVMPHTGFSVEQTGVSFLHEIYLVKKQKKSINPVKTSFRDGSVHHDICTISEYPLQQGVR